METKKYIVQVNDPSTGWRQSWNIGADGKYTKESAERRARYQQRKTITSLKYRIKEAK